MGDNGGGGNGSSDVGSTTTGSNNGVVDTVKAERSVWLMKCPPVVSRTWQANAADPPQSVAKVVLSLDPLRPDEPYQFKMELTQKEPGNVPKSYSLNMFKDFVPMCVFSESNQGQEEINSNKGI